MHAVSQQTASTQCALVHAWSPVQATPVASLGAQMPAEQKSPVMQSVSTVHGPVHWVAEQT